jgi:protein-tyrosine phosphatase
MSKRILAFEGIDNFRDYGDYATTAGRTIKPGRLFRSAHHGAATDADLARMAGLGIAHVVDLRRPSERERQPSRRPAAFGAKVIENNEGDQEEAPHVAFLRQTDLTEGEVHAFMLNYYDNAPFEARHLDLFSRYFQAVAAGDGPVLIHCAAGKDRTGILAALTHHVLGVHDDDVIEDYLLTNIAARIEARTPMAAEMMRETFGREPSVAAVRALLGVDAAYLDKAFVAIKAQYGDLDAYLTRAVGLDGDMRDRVRHNLLD